MTLGRSFDEQFDGWANFIERTTDRPPRPLLVSSLDYLQARNAALDLGSGSLSDTRYLVEQGFKSVTAVDREAGPLHVQQRLPDDRFRQVLSSFEAFDFEKDAYDLISAQFALPFIAPDKFEDVFAAIRRALRSGGVLTGQLFGDRDDWFGTEGMTFHTAAEAERILAPFDVLYFEEEDDPLAATAAGDPKHWHIFHFIASRRT